LHFTEKFIILLGSPVSESKFCRTGPTSFVVVAAGEAGLGGGGLGEGVRESPGAESGALTLNQPVNSSLSTSADVNTLAPQLMDSSHCLGDILSRFHLVETECWAVLHLASLELQRSLLALCSMRSASLLQMAEATLVSATSLQLKSNGRVEIKPEARQNILEALPLSVSPLSELSLEDWQKVGLHSVSQLMASSLQGQGLSREMAMFLNSIVGQHMASIPPLADVLIFLQRKIKLDSAARLVASVCYKLDGILAADTRSMDRKFASASDTRLRLSPPPRSRLTTSCPSLSHKEVARQPLGPASATALENFINNNEVFSLLELPGLKFSRRRTNNELMSSELVPKKQQQVFMPSFLRQQERPPLRVNLMAGGRTCGQVVRVLLPTGQRLEFTLDKMKVRVRELLAASLDRLQVRLEAQVMFGLFRSSSSSELLYLDLEALLVHHLDKGVLSLSLRFLQRPDYPDLCPQLQHLLYLQLRQDVLAGQLISLGHSQAVQLALLAFQAECESADLYQIQPKYFLPALSTDAATMRFLEKNQSIRLTGSRELAQGLFCETLLSMEDCQSFRYHGRETRAEASKRITLRIHQDGFSLLDQSFEWEQLRQLSYSQSYLQLLVKTSQDLRRFKIFFPDDKAIYIHDLVKVYAVLAVEKVRRVQQQQQGGGGKSRRSLGVICNQIVEVAKEVSKSIRTPKRSRSLSSDAGGKRMRLSSLGKAFHTPQKSSFNPVPVKASQTPVKACRIVPLSPPPPPLPPHAPSRHPPAVPPAVLRSGPKPPAALSAHSRRGEDKENVMRTGVRMGTRTMARGCRRRSDESAVEDRRILQVEVRRDQVGLDSVSVSGHGITVSRWRGKTSPTTMAVGELQVGDRILALNGVSVEEVSLETFWRILYSFRGSVNMIISRPA
jgi:hypothetical protein